MKVWNKNLCVVCVLAFWAAASIDTVQAGTKFTIADKENLCKAIKTQSLNDIPRYMDTLIKKAKITKEQWNTHYVFKVDCHGHSPVVYSIQQSFEAFKVMADYGVDLSHPVRDDMGNISTLKDWVRFKAKKLIKFKKIYETLKKKKAKGCNDLPANKCTATYPLAPKQKQ